MAYINGNDNFLILVNGAKGEKGDSCKLTEKTVAEIIKYGGYVNSVEWENGRIDPSGVLDDIATYVRTKDFLKVEENAPFVIERANEKVIVFLVEYDADKNFISRQTGDMLTPIEPNCAFIKVTVYSAVYSQSTMHEYVTIRSQYNVMSEEDMKDFINDKYQEATDVIPQTVVELIKYGYRTVPIEWESGGIHTDGTNKADDTAIRSVDFMQIKEGTTITIKGKTSKVVVYLAEYDENKNFIARQSGAELTHLNSNCAYIKFSIWSNTYTQDTLSEYAEIQEHYALLLPEETEDIISDTNIVIGEMINHGYRTVPIEWENGAINGSGVAYNKDTAVRSKDFIAVDSETTIEYIRATAVNLSLYLFEYDKDKNFIESQFGTNVDFLSPQSANCAFVKFVATSTAVSQGDLPSCLTVRAVSKNIHPTTSKFDMMPILSINHRGFNNIAPENTLPAYRLSKQKGFDIVECDIHFTADGVPVLLHDDTINATARNADGSILSENIYVKDRTYDELLAYDFGIYKGTQYAGTKIPTFEEFILLCRKLDLCAYVEFKDGFTQDEVEAVVALVKKYGMQKFVTYIGNTVSLSHVSKIDYYARLGMVTANATEYLIKSFRWYCKTPTNQLFVDHSIANLTTELIDMIESYGMTVEAYCPNTEEDILGLDYRIRGITSDTLVAKEVILNANIGQTDTGIV